MEASALLLLICLLAVYFLPSLVAWKKDKFEAVFVLNLFLGWTFVGWIIALAWGANPDRR